MFQDIRYRRWGEVLESKREGGGEYVCGGICAIGSFTVRSYGATIKFVARNEYSWSEG
jgi:hypothetical protein